MQLEDRKKNIFSQRENNVSYFLKKKKGYEL